MKNMISLMNRNFPLFVTLSSYPSVNSICAKPPPPQATAGHLPALSVPGVGHLQILRCPGAGHLPTPGPTPNVWHARGFLSEYNYTEDFTGNTIRLSHLPRFDRFTLQILASKSGGVWTNLSFFLYNTSEMKQHYLSYRPRTECGISQFFKKNCTWSIFRTINRGLLAKTFKKFPKSPIRPAGSHFYSASCQCGRVFEWTLIELRFNIITNLLLLFFVI